ncbi:antibiotic biosynthesis monooxygenase family protein [Sinosporangium siamense]|uniref:Antibiotic biosynthesis monooxygenase n=1 Tax=Sinosporangium siamense TaxID=1367973 RepID=A0A919V7E7_9ACTN|nr:antibiotic biosynthesis monooxygenase family protein [Sinosporangium siamense]GII95055.1 antibiotic biosynthesis monooxygenase [Sinosporangium siamense]
MSDRGTARVLIYYRAPGGDSEVIEKAYHEISAEMAGTAGLLRNELIRDADEPDSFLVLSEWQDLDAFRLWERGPQHRGTTSPLRQYQDRDRGRRHYGIYQVVAAY